MLSFAENMDAIVKIWLTFGSFWVYQGDLAFFTAFYEYLRISPCAGL